MVLTDDEDKASYLSHLSKQARAGEDYEHDAIGFNYRMTNVNAAIGIAQLERLTEMLARRREIACAYDEALAGCNVLTAPPSLVGQAPVDGYIRYDAPIRGLQAQWSNVFARRKLKPVNFGARYRLRPFTASPRRFYQVFLATCPAALFRCRLRVPSRKKSLSG